MSSADLAGDVTAGVASSVVSEVASSADIAEVVSSAQFAGDVTVAWSVIMMTICMMDILTINQTILTMMIRVTLIVTLVCMALLGRITMSFIMICMAWMTVGVYCVSWVDVGVVPYWSGDEEGDVYEGDVDLPRTGSDELLDMFGYSVVSTFGLGGPCDEEGDVYEGDVACPGPVPTSCSIELLVHPGRVDPVIRKVTFMRVMLPCPGPVPTNNVVSTIEAPVMRVGRCRTLPEM